MGATQPDRTAKLRVAGFVQFGSWQLEANSFPQIVGEFPCAPGVYSFVVGNEVDMLAPLRAA